MSDEISSEKYLIGSMLRDYPLVRKSANKFGLESNHFEESTTRSVWTCAEELNSKGIEVDTVSVIESLEKNKHLDQESISALLIIVSLLSNK